MTTQPSMFKTSEGQARYFAAYDATLGLWPVPRESLDVPTRFGATHVHACGPQDAPPLVLVPGQAVSSTMWYPNIAALSRAYRVYAPDIIGDMGKSVRTRPFTKPAEFADWLNDLFDALKIERAHVAVLWRLHRAQAGSLDAGAGEETCPDGSGEPAAPSPTVLLSYGGCSLACFCFIPSIQAKAIIGRVFPPCRTGDQADADLDGLPL